jgi:hypothetical protein
LVVGERQGDEREGVQGIGGTERKGIEWRRKKEWQEKEQKVESKG